MDNEFSESELTYDLLFWSYNVYILNLCRSYLSSVFDTEKFISLSFQIYAEIFAVQPTQELKQRMFDELSKDNINLSEMELLHKKFDDILKTYMNLKKGDASVGILQLNVKKKTRELLVTFEPEF